MEQFFSPIRRLQDIYEVNMDADDDPFAYTEVALAIPLEDFLVNRSGWIDLWTFLSADVRRKFLWLTDNTFITVGGLSEMFNHGTPYPYNYLLFASSTTTSGQLQTLKLMKEIDANVSTKACNVFWRAIETNRNEKIEITGYSINPSSLPSGPSRLPSGPILSQLLQGRPLRQGLDFCDFCFEEEHCRALATIQRTDLKITLTNCALVPKNADDIFIEWFRHNQGRRAYQLLDEKQLSLCFKLKHS
jgi:hypothetical protein